VSKHLLALIVALFLAGGCRNGDSISRTRPAGKIVDIPANAFVVQWVAPLQLARGDALSHLYHRGDDLLVYSRNNRVTWLSPSGGQIRYAADVAGREDTVGPPLALKDVTLFPTSTSLRIFRNGKVERKLELGHAIRSAPAGENNIVYVGLDYSNGGRLAKLDISKPYGNSIWELRTSGGMSSAPVLFAQVIYTASENGYVYAVSEDRLPVWSLANSAFKTDGRILADIKVDDFGVYVASTDSKLYCLDRITGKLKWVYFGGESLNIAPVVTADSVYQAIPRVGIAAIDKTAGDYDRKPRWLMKGTTQFLSEDEQNVYLRSVENQIVGVDKKTGQEKFRSTRKDLRLFATNQKPDGMIYAAAVNGDVYAIRPVLKAGAVGELARLFVH